MEPEDSRVLPLQEVRLRHALFVSEETTEQDRCGERGQLRARSADGSESPASRRCCIVAVPRSPLNQRQQKSDHEDIVLRTCVAAAR